MSSPLETAVGHVRRYRREAGAAAAGVLVVALAISVLFWRRAVDDVPTAAVQRTLFTETLVETGTIGAQRLALYSSTISGAQAKIVELVPEGRAVQPGDVLVRFDASTFEQTRARERASLSQAEADLIRAREEYRIETLRVDGDLERSRRQIEFAEAGLKNQLEGRGRVELAEANAAAGEAARELTRAKKSYDDLKPLLAEGLITKAELDRAEQAWHRAEELKTLADAKRDTLVQYEQPAANGRAQGDVHAARSGFERERATASARADQRRAAVDAAESRVQEIKARIALLDDQINRAAIRATTAGLVIYRDLFFGTDRRKPQVGDEVWPNQPIIALPDSSQLIVETRIREIDLHKVSASQRVEVQVDAYPDLRLPAAVSLVGALAQEDPARAATKFFPVTIALRASDPRLRTGMTARVQIDVRALPHALVVPIEAVFDQAGQSTVFVLRSDRWERRTVTVAAENETQAALQGGVEPGDRVALVDPTTTARRPR